MVTCAACDGPSQFRLFICFDCWRLVPAELLAAWNAARTGEEKLAIAARILRWAAGEHPL